MIRLAALALLVAGAFVVVTTSLDLSAEGVRDHVDGYGAAGPLVFIAVSSLLTVALFPGPLLAGASGLLFGTALGTPVSIVSATTGATLAFSLARWIAHDAVEEVASPRVQRLRAWIGRRGFLAVLYARLAPGLPYTLVNYAAGLAPIAVRSFVAATAIGCAPRAFAYTALGGSLSDLSRPEAIIAFAVLVVMAIGGVVFARRAARAEAQPSASSPPVRSR
ncbi:MAG TPA: TVP38/TMEM64 family protein [Solirubrobacteraceae bacterium]